MGQITIFTREGCPNCQAVRLDLKLCHLPYQEIVLEPTELQKAPLIYFDNYPIAGGVNELLDMLQDWEVVDGPDGKPTLERMRPSAAHYQDHHYYQQQHHHHQGDPHRSNNTQSYNSNGYHSQNPESYGNNGYHQHNSRRINSQDSSSYSKDSGYSRGGRSYADHPYHHRDGYQGDYGYREEGYRDDPYSNRGYHRENDHYRDNQHHQDDYYRGHQEYNNGQDYYRDQHRDNSNNFHRNHYGDRHRDNINSYSDSHTESNYRDAYNRSDRPADPYARDFHRDPYSGESQSATCSQPQRDAYHGSSDPYHDSYRGSSPHTDSNRNADDTYRDSHHSYHRGDNNRHEAPRQDSHRDPYSHRSPQENRDHHSLSPYNLYKNSHRDDDSYVDEGHRDPHYRDESYNHRSFREDSYRDPNSFDDPYGLGHKNAPARDARSIEAIQNRFHFRDNNGKRDLYKRSASAKELYRENSLSSVNSNLSSRPKPSLPSISRRDQLQKKDSYESRSFRLPDRQTLKKEKYQDDDNPFHNSSTSVVTTTPGSRRDLFHNKASYDRHSFHGKTLLQQRQSESNNSQGDNGQSGSDVATPAPSTQPKTTTSEKEVSNRRDLMGKKSYDRHSFHGKTLHHQHQNEPSQHDDSQSGSDAAAPPSASDRLGTRREMLRKKSSFESQSFRGKAALQKNEADHTSQDRKAVQKGNSQPESSVHGSAHGNSSVKGGSVAGSAHSHSIHVDLDRDSLADDESESFSGEEEDDDKDDDESSDGSDDDGTQDFSYCSAKELDDALSRLSGSSKSRRGSKSSLSPDDLAAGEDESETEHSIRSSLSVRSSLGEKKPTKVFSLGNDGGGSRLERFSRSFRQNSSKSLTSKLSAGKASSMRYLSPNDTTSSAGSGLDSRSRRRNTLTSSRSMSPTPTSGATATKSSTSGMSSGLKAARSAALLKKSSMRLSNNLNSSVTSQSSTGSMWSNSPGPAIKDDKRSVELPIGNRMSVLEAMQELKRITPLGDLKHNLTTYRNSFTGTTLCDAFQERFRLSRREAEDLGKSLGQAQILTHVSGDHSFADTEKLFFRLQCHQTPEILNSFCLWQDELSLTKNAADVMDEVMERLLVIMDAITDSAKGRVHYSRATKHHEDLVAELDYAICELQMVKLARLDKNALLAFGLNVFQVFLHYAFIKVGIPSSSSAFNSFWTNLKFNVGSDVYSFADWWNGICRGNRKGPHGPKPFQGKDSRCFLNLPEPLDPRIHFAAGMTHFLRPMFVYSGENIHGELEHVARIYCKNVEFVWMETSTNTLTLAPTFQTYQSDFASSAKLIPKAIMQWLPGKEKAHVDEMLTVHKKIKVEFHDNVKNDGWDEYAGEHFLYQTAPRADFKKIITSKKKQAPERREVKRQGSLKSLFRLEGAAAS